MEIHIRYTDDETQVAFFPVVFGVSSSTLKFETYQRSILGIREVFRAVDIALYGSPTHFEIYVTPLEDGSVIAWIGRSSGWAAALAVGLVVQDGTKGFVQGLTNRSIEEWGEAAGDHLEEIWQKRESVSETQAKLIEADCARRLLEISQEEFEEVISERPEAAHRAQEGRRVFYEACRANEDVGSIRFSTKAETPLIPREEFQNRMVRDFIELPPIDVSGLRGSWGSAILDFEITSPNWERQDQQRGWKGKLPDGKYIYFTISDTRFWSMFSDHKLQSNPPDRMMAQVVFQYVNGRYRSSDVVKVLNFNSVSISDPIDEQTIRQFIEQLNAADGYEQGLLFQSKPPEP